MTVSQAFKVHSERRVLVDVARRPLLWLNLVCLDAPLVAIVWQELFARAFNASVSGADRSALFLTAWWIYLADRVVDSLTMREPPPARARADFSRRHLPFLICLAHIVAIADVVVIATSLTAEVFRRGLVVGAVAMVYLLLNLRLSRLWRTLPLKEFIIGFLFALGTVLSISGARFSSSFFLSFLLFACLCALNCLSIAFWEREIDLIQKRDSFATKFPGAVGVIWLGCVSIMALAAAGGGRSFPPVVAAPLASAALLLFVLHFVALKRDERTACADLALLLPPLFFLVVPF
jgi:hypothetical protein